MKELFKHVAFRRKAQATIKNANAIIDQYAAMGMKLTLRQLYYQFVSMNLIANTQNSYDRLGKIISDARIAGLIDWHAIIDRTRNLRSWKDHESPEAAMAELSKRFNLDKWADQDYRVEVWIEKEALVGVIEHACSDLNVPFFACRGYVSQSEQYAAGKRFEWHRHEFRSTEDDSMTKPAQEPIVIHLGDHDPSGIDMTRDNDDRIAMFARLGVEVRRIALNMDQVEEHKPPPNPAKLTDSRAAGYIQRFGNDSWELDALKPIMLRDLIRSTVLEYRDEDRYNGIVARETEAKVDLKALSDRYGYAVKAVKWKAAHGARGGVSA